MSLCKSGTACSCSPSLSARRTGSYSFQNGELKPSSASFLTSSHDGLRLDAAALPDVDALPVADVYALPVAGVDALPVAGVDALPVAGVVPEAGAAEHGNARIAVTKIR